MQYRLDMVFNDARVNWRPSYGDINELLNRLFAVEIATKNLYNFVSNARGIPLTFNSQPPELRRVIEHMCRKLSTDEYRERFERVLTEYNRTGGYTHDPMATTVLRPQA